MSAPERWVAALPMYNVSPALREDWHALLARIAERLARSDTPVALSVVEPGEGAEALHAFWRRDDVLLSQTCGYPLIHGLAGHIQLIGTPSFAARGCVEHRYTSAIMVRAKDGPATLTDCQGMRVACNDRTSHSGMNALRHAVAPLARDGRFFAHTVYTGSHLCSLASVAEGEADVAAIDCVTLAFAREHMPAKLEGLRQIGETRAVAGLPFIASRRVGQALLDNVRLALCACLREDAALCARLRLRDLVPATVADYLPHAQMEDEAHRRGYAELR
ncbi:ABC-type phosphate/phosphonate transport system, substrate-binding protein [Cupriavidus sp. OV038]|jgi:ABC-type phosphate/phosphonate transport system substrate-binding protein|uniref:phosphate/phosphite/phosphonate ABC transporter substrate-binding protein n=1 Tax=unclassified Cupriavidus TaxID=2640874 RepID=UPI0008E11A8E|nr:MULTISPECIES: PhnD/SsuA/transferrin family substrate-binding protein [unclassified Cupriavidus]SFD22898.1 ABC-type phosphate/phosphonate transport system, substrate-binding protein [Cupriavidus sp. OV038]SFP92148.1 ABC-type phosphate/phosphonate transport system, substrate-binding protein [Cupriavidus sp. OV096]